MLFDRHIEFIFGKTRYEYMDVGASIDIRDKGYIISNNLHMKFEIKKDDTSSPNECLLKIWNLSDDTIERIIKTKDSIGIIRAGYNYGEISTIFVGDIIWSFPTQDNQDLILEIKLADGFKKFKDTTIYKSYDKKVKAKQLINEAVKSFIDVNSNINSISIANEKEYNSPVLSGYTNEVLNSLAKDNGLTWSFQDGNINFLYSTPKKIVDHDIPTVTLTNGGYQYYRLNEQTGMINSPKRHYEKNEDENDNTEKIEVDSFLLPQLKIGGYVSLESKYIDMGKTRRTFYQVKNFTHIGDNYNGDFTTRMEIHAI